MSINVCCCYEASSENFSPESVMYTFMFDINIYKNRTKKMCQKIYILYVLMFFSGYYLGVVKIWSWNEEVYHEELRRDNIEAKKR